MKVLVLKDADALVIVDHFLALNRHMVVDRKWAGDGNPTVESYISVDASRDEIPTLAAGIAGLAIDFALVEENEGDEVPFQRREASDHRA